MNGTSNGRDWKPTEDELVHLLDATNASVNRVRQVLIVMSTASIIVFAAVWNTLEFSWMRWRADGSASAEIWLAYQQDPKEKARWDALKGKVASGKADEAERDRLLAWQEKLAAGEKYVAREFLPPAQIKERAKKYREAVQDWVVAIRIPFFGIVIDANDATLLGGFTLYIIMMWLRLSLWRQCSNLSMAFFQAAAVDRLPFAYRYASMQQVLSIPPPTADGGHRLRPKHGAPPILFCLPGTVLAVALIHDALTFDSVSDAFYHALLQTIVAGGLLAIIVYLTFQCHQLRKESGRTWERYFATLGNDAASPAS